MSCNLRTCCLTYNTSPVITPSANSYRFKYIRHVTRPSLAQDKPRLTCKRPSIKQSNFWNVNQNHLPRMPYHALGRKNSYETSRWIFMPESHNWESIQR